MPAKSKVLVSLSLATQVQAQGGDLLTRRRVSESHTEASVNYKQRGFASHCGFVGLSRRPFTNDDVL